MKTALEYLNILTDLQNQISVLQKEITSDDTALLVTEEFAEKYYNFVSESGLDFIYHNYKQCVMLGITEKEFNFSYIQVRNHSSGGNKITGNSVYLTNAIQSDDRRWSSKWKAVHRFENVSIDNFIKLCEKLGLTKTIDEKPVDPYYQDINLFLNAR